MVDPESPEDAFERGKRVQLAADVEALRALALEYATSPSWLSAVSGAADHLERTFRAGAEPQEEEE